MPWLAALGQGFGHQLGGYFGLAALARRRLNLHLQLAAGRDARNKRQLLQRGIDSTMEFIERQQKLMDDQGSGVG